MDIHQRIERKLDILLRMAGLELSEIADLNNAKDDAALEALTAKLKASSDALKATVAAQQPK